MKKILIPVLSIVILVACKAEKKETDVYKDYPESLAKVLKKHGGLDNWKKLQVLSFNNGEEVHTVDLHSRKTLVTTPTYSIGYDGNEVWVSDTTVYKKDPKFFYNLYFYFYAMPFVLADDGISYSETEPISYNGVEYPGIKISYKADVGTSPDDNYFLYFHPETNQMEWLGYTVTYFSKKPSTKANLIRYNMWEDVNGFLLPKELTWFKKDSLGNPTEPARAPLKFTLPLVSQAKLADSYYKKPAAE